MYKGKSLERSIFREIVRAKVIVLKILEYISQYKYLEGLVSYL
jgi:hypothetical protein